MAYRTGPAPVEAGPNRCHGQSPDLRSCLPHRGAQQKESGAGPVLHRHLNDNAGYQPAAVDDIISRGLWQDWVELRQAALDNPSLLDVIERVCRAFTDDPYAQRHHFWLEHVRRRRKAG